MADRLAIGIHRGDRHHETIRPADHLVHEVRGQFAGREDGDVAGDLLRLLINDRQAIYGDTAGQCMGARHIERPAAIGDAVAGNVDDAAVADEAVDIEKPGAEFQCLAHRGAEGHAARIGLVQPVGKGGGGPDPSISVHGDDALAALAAPLDIDDGDAPAHARMHGPLHFRIAEGGNEAPELQRLFLAVHRGRHVRRDDQFEIHLVVPGWLTQAWRACGPAVGPRRSKAARRARAEQDSGGADRAADESSGQ